MMQVTVKVHTKSSKPRVEFLESIYHVYISAIPQKGEANEAVIKALSEFLGVSVMRLRIVSGFKNRNKQVEITD